MSTPPTALLRIYPTPLHPQHQLGHPPRRILDVVHPGVGAFVAATKKPREPAVRDAVACDCTRHHGGRNDDVADGAGASEGPRHYPQVGEARRTSALFCILFRVPSRLPAGTMRVGETLRMTVDVASM